MTSSTRLPAALLLVLACGPAREQLDAGLPVDSSVDAVIPRVDAAADSAVPPDARADASVPVDATVPVDSAVSFCMPRLACDGAGPEVTATGSWRHSIATGATVLQGGARHRGRDLFLRETDAQWALAKFAYGVADADLTDEDVQVWVDRNCAGNWQMVGKVATTRDGDHATVWGVEDSGGSVYLELTGSARLPVGRHRIHFVVEGDGTRADQIIEVLEANARIAVSDVDGTLTESENAAFTELFNGMMPAVQPAAPEALQELARRGFHIFYLTARPHWLAARTHEWVKYVGLPPGIVHTTLGLTGATGSAAVTFKEGELRDLAGLLGAPPAFGIGNKDTDAEAYETAAIAADHRLLYQLTGDPFGGVVFQSYLDLMPLFSRQDVVCPR